MKNNEQKYMFKKGIQDMKGKLELEKKKVIKFIKLI